MSEPPIIELLDKTQQPLLSFEFFPPKEDKAFAMLEKGIEQLRAVQPDFVSVTYGAGGTTRKRTMTVSELLRTMDFTPVMPHLTCVGASRDELTVIADDIHSRGFRNIMALRGDPPQREQNFQPVADGLTHASELINLLKTRHPDICLGCAGYPETHPEAESPEADIRHLRNKLDAGADFVTTQLFFENNCYFDFVEQCRKAGIDKPIIPGLLPAISLKQVERVMSLSHAAFPPELRSSMEEAGGSGSETESIGIQWTVKQIDELIEHGAPGIHLYILNRTKTALAPALMECVKRWRIG